MKTSEYGFPSHLISPEHKGKDWILKYCKAAWGQYNSAGWNSAYANRLKYRSYTDYAYSTQSIGGYKKTMGVDESADKTLISIDWKPLAVFTRLRNLALAITNKVNYDIAATPIDPAAQSQIKDYFKKMETKVRLRDELRKINPELVEQTPLRRESGEPEDLDELEIQKMYTYKHQLSIEIEQFLGVIFEHNNVNEVRATVRQDIFDKGIGGVRECIDTDGSIKIRPVRPEGYICSPCNNRDHSDTEWQGEVIQMTVSELIEQAGDVFQEAEYQEMARMFGTNSSASPFRGAYGNYRVDYDDAKINVLDIEFLSTNSMFYESSVDKYGNHHFTRINPSKARSREVRGAAPQVVYKAKWVVGTDYIYDYGIATDMKRRKSQLAKTEKSFHMFAPNWDATKLQAIGITEQCITIIDQMNLAWYRLQHAIATARPKGISIELSSLENINLGKGGEALKPRDVLELYNTTGMMVWRRVDIDGESQHYRPMEELENGIGRQAEEYYNIILKNIAMLRETLGLNEATDSFTGSRTYGAAVEAAVEATNNSLFNIIQADFEVMKRLSNATILRIQAIARRAKVHPGYLAALGENTMRFFKAGLDISAHEFGIVLEPKPSSEERARFLMRVDEFVKAGSIDIEDALMIENTENLKAAGQILAYKIRKRRKEAQEEAQRMQEMNAQVQMQSNQAAEEAKRQTLQAEYQLKMQAINLEKEWDYRIEQLRVQGRVMGDNTKAGALLEQESMRNESREYQTEILAAARKESEDKKDSQRNMAQKESDLVK